MTAEFWWLWQFLCGLQNFRAVPYLSIAILVGSGARSIQLRHDTPCSAHVCSERRDNSPPYIATSVCEIQRAYLVARTVPDSVLAVAVPSTPHLLRMLIIDWRQ